MGENKPDKNWVITPGKDGLTFGERLKDIMFSQGITANSLASSTGISQSAISDFLRDYGREDSPKPRVPGSDTILALSKQLGVSTDYLFGLSEIKTSDRDEQIAIEYTGLSEKNVNTLHFMKEHAHIEAITDDIKYENGKKVISMDPCKPFLDCFNDIMEAMRSDPETIVKFYFAIRQNANAPKMNATWYCAHGYSILGNNTNRKDRDAAEYACMKVAREVETRLKEKYIWSKEQLEKYYGKYDDDGCETEWD